MQIKTARLRYRISIICEPHCIVDKKKYRTTILFLMLLAVVLRYRFSFIDLIISESCVPLYSCYLYIFYVIGKMRIILFELVTFSWMHFSPSICVPMWTVWDQYFVRFLSLLYWLLCQTLPKKKIWTKWKKYWLYTNTVVTNKPSFADTWCEHCTTAQIESSSHVYGTTFL